MGEQVHKDFIVYCEKGNKLKVKEYFEILLPNFSYKHVFESYFSLGLTAACNKGQIEVLYYLLDLPVEEEFLSSVKETCILQYFSVVHEADCQNRYNCFQLIIRNVKVNLVDSEVPLLILALKNSEESYLKLLIEAGAEVNRVDKCGLTPLMYACIEGKLSSVRLLIDSGANVNAIDKKGMSAIIHATIAGKTNCVTELLLSRCDLHIVDESGSSALFYACNMGKSDLVSFLIGSGWSNASTWTGQSSQYYCSRSDYLEIAKVLVSHGLRHDKSVFGSNPIRMNWLLELFLVNPTDIIYKQSSYLSPSILLSTDKKNQSILHYALIEKKSVADINTIITFVPETVIMRDENGHFPVHIAIAAGCYDLSLIWQLLVPVPTIFDVPIEYQLLYDATRITQWSFQCIHIHLCGHGFAGKTTCTKALSYTLKYLNMFSYYMSSSPSEVKVDRSNGLGTTEGMDIFEVQTQYNRWMIRDYGGQKDYHTNHARFLSIPGSVNVIVVALWDEEHNVVFSINEIILRYKYWLKFLKSISGDEGNVHCITIINFANKVEPSFVTTTTTAIKDCITKWKEACSVVTFIGEPTVINVCQTTNVRQINSFLQEYGKLLESSSYSVMTYINAVERAFEKVTLNRKTITKLDFMTSVCKIALQLIASQYSDVPPVEQVEFLCHKMIDHLCSTGRIMLVRATSTIGDPLLVLDIHWFAKDLLGRLTSRMCSADNLTYVLTAVQIDEFTNGGSSHFGGSIESLLNFLEGIGACVPVKTTVANEIKRWFPIIAQRNYRVNTECIPLSVSLTVGQPFKGRQVIRKFYLKDPEHTMFPPGYFTNLFLKITGLFSFGDIEEIKVYLDGMELLMVLDSMRLQFILTVNESENYFTIVVSSIKSCVDLFTLGFSDCWTSFSAVYKLIMNVSTDDEKKSNITSTSPWFDHLKFEERFVNPNNSQTVTTAQLNELNQPRRNLYLYGCDELGNPVNEKDLKMNIFEVLHNKTDKLQDILDSKWNHVCIGLSTDMIQPLMDTNGDASFSSKVNNTVESCLTYLDSGDARSINQVQILLTNLKLDLQTEPALSDINSTVAMNTMINTLNTVHDSILLLTKDVQSLRESNLTSGLEVAIVSAIEQSASLRRINNMLYTVVSDTHEVPSLAIVIPVSTSNFDPRNWTMNKFRLLFVCSHTLQVVPCGPKGKGYKFSRPKEWFRKVCPVIKACLVIAKLALTISGIPIPINNVIEGIDNASAVTESTKYLSNALGIMEMVNNVADNVGDLTETVGLNEVDIGSYLQSMDKILSSSQTIEAYKSIEELLREVDPTLSYIGVTKMTCKVSGITGWVKREACVMESFEALKGERCPLDIAQLKNKYDAACDSSSGGDKCNAQSLLGIKAGLNIPNYLFSKKSL